MKTKFDEDKKELMNQKISLLKDLEEMKNNESLKNYQLMDIQKQIDKMDNNNKKFANINNIILNENFQLKNEKKI